ncbi:MAG TPA: hypothetical protein VMJ33_10310 [Gallionella sp.]|nr:hypothetical protein [Gallionella sp.]
MNDKINETSNQTTDEHDSTFQVAFAWLTTLSVSIAAWAYLS